MSWEDRLIKASFKGIEFLYEDTTRSGGHRVVVHEYPWMDEPYPENMGLKKKEYSFNAYYIGTDYDLKADQLEKTLDSFGTGSLVLPHSGNIEVQSLPWQRVDSTQKQGMAKFTLKFVQAGKKHYTHAEKNATARLIDHGEQLANTFLETFTTALGLWQALRNAADFEIQDQKKQIQKVFDPLNNPAETNNTAEALNHWTNEVVTKAQPQRPKSWTDQPISYTGNLPALLAEQQTKQQQLLEQIENSIEPPQLLIHALQVHTAETALRIGTRAYKSYDEASNIFQGINTLITNVTEYQTLRDDYTNGELHQWADLRVTISEAIEQQQMVLPKIKHMQLTDTLPSVVIAHRLYQDAALASVLEEQNQIPHPAFTQGIIEYLEPQV